MTLSVEIERKFLIRKMPMEKLVHIHKIRQGYISREGNNSVRVREKDNQFILSIKTQLQSGVRNELEYNISKGEGEVLFASLSHDAIIKSREVYEINGLIWEIDIFEGANKGLIVAEIELDNTDQVIDIPNWLGPEVTELSKFYNANLAGRPFDKWRVSYDALIERLEG
jgi:adenylate cyclase